MFAWLGRLGLIALLRRSAQDSYPDTWMESGLTVLAFILLVFVIENASFDNVTELFSRAASFFDPRAEGPRSIAAQAIVVIRADLAILIHLDLRDITMACSASTDIIMDGEGFPALHSRAEGFRVDEAVEIRDFDILVLRHSRHGRT